MASLQRPWQVCIFVSREEVIVGLMLGPMPASVRVTVSKLVQAARGELSDANSRFLGYLLHGGPSSCDFLDADGEVWCWSAWDDTVEHVPDGPRKVGAVAIAAKRIPALAAWFPIRPINAVDCNRCRAQGWLEIMTLRLLCPECHGMGWIPQEVRG